MIASHSERDDDGALVRTRSFLRLAAGLRETRRSCAARPRGASSFACVPLKALPPLARVTPPARGGFVRPPAGERGSLPRTVRSFGERPPDGCRGERGACRRQLAVRDRAEGAGLVRDCAGAQPRPPPRAGPAAPWCGFGALAGSSTAWLSFVRTAPAAPVAAPPSRRSRRFQVAARDVATSPLPVAGAGLWISFAPRRLPLAACVGLFARERARFSRSHGAAPARLA